MARHNGGSGLGDIDLALDLQVLALDNPRQPEQTDQAYARALADLLDPHYAGLWCVCVYDEATEIVTGWAG